jgi:hypothetical protein
MVTIEVLVLGFSWLRALENTAQVPACLLLYVVFDFTVHIVVAMSSICVLS